MKKTIIKLYDWFESNSSKLEKYATGVLRIGLAIVILWFSTQQFIHTEYWTAYVPDYVVLMSGLSSMTLVYFNAIFELIFGIMLVFGIQTRISALLLSLHLFEIMFVVGYGETGVRDFGLALALFVVYMNGSDIFCIQQKKVII